MADSEDQAPGVKAFGPVKALKLFVAIQRTIRLQHKTDSPEFVILTERASAVAKLAERLARAARQDALAVRELQQLAGHHRHALPDALKHFKSLGRDREWRHYNLSARLIEAAIGKTSVAPEDPQLTARFDAVQRLTSLDPEARFAELATLEPKLHAVKESIGVGPARQMPLSQDELRQQAARTMQVYERLRPLVGPGRPDYELLLSTQTALDLVGHYLLLPSA